MSTCVAVAITISPCLRVLLAGSSFVAVHCFVSLSGGSEVYNFVCSAARSMKTIAANKFSGCAAAKIARGSFRECVGASCRRTLGLYRGLCALCFHFLQGWQRLSTGATSSRGWAFFMCARHEFECGEASDVWDERFVRNTLPGNQYSMSQVAGHHCIWLYLMGGWPLR